MPRRNHSAASPSGRGGPIDRPAPSRSGPNIPESQRGSKLVGLRLGKAARYPERLRQLADAAGMSMAELVESWIDREDGGAA